MKIFYNIYGIIAAAHLWICPCVYTRQSTFELENAM